jgi:predicted phosphoadenosine phosphosulfate sulfurtransferase
MRRVYTGYNVFDAAVGRIRELYEEGHTLVVSMSGGKDSGACLEVCLEAARDAGALPVYCAFQDEEIYYPGTTEYLERVAARDEVEFRWFNCGQPMVNVFDRVSPYFWVFDDLVDPDDWVRKPPEWATPNPELNIENIIHPRWFPVAEGKTLIDVVGLRVSESSKRMLGLVSSGGYLTGEGKRGGVPFRKARPIYDWTDSDVWTATIHNNWDYNKAYEVMVRMGISKKNLRIGPPTINTSSANALKMASSAWPKWFDRVCRRLNGVRQAAQFGALVCEPRRRSTETWRDTFRRTCIEEAPAEWIADRARKAEEILVRKHAGHSNDPLPNEKSCMRCGAAGLACYRRLAHACFNGDPFSLKLRPISSGAFPYMEPEFFREGAGTWGGTPTW